MSISIEQALSAERPLLERIRESADYVIDTTYLSAKQLRERVVGIFLDDKNQAMLVNCTRNKIRAERLSSRSWETPSKISPNTSRLRTSPGL